MSTHKDDIEKLFSTKFERFEVSPSEGEWLSLSSKLSRMNFWKFSFSSLNVYSLVVLSALAGAAIWLGVANIQLTEKNNILRDSIRVYQEKARTISLPSVDSTSIPLKDQHPSDMKSEKVSVQASPVKKVVVGGKSVNRVKPEDKQASNQQGKDSVRNVVPATPRNDSVVQNPVRRVKKLVVVKPKTVVVKDTVNITRPSK